MSLFLITGIAGTGKSTVCEALKTSGQEAYDVDSDGFAKWLNLETGYIHPKSSVKAADRTPEFLKSHDWHVPRDEIRALRDKAAGRLVFLCGDFSNKEEVRDLFDTVFALQIDDETLKHRLLSRATNDWGKQPHELQSSLEKNRAALETYHALDATIIDGGQQVQQVMNEIVSKAQAIASA